MTELEILRKGRLAVINLYEELNIELESFNSNDDDFNEEVEDYYTLLQAKVDILSDAIMLLNHGEI